MEFRFDFFNDIVKADDFSSNQCSVHKDAFVAYCEQCRHPLCVQDMLLHSRSSPGHAVKSFGELKGVLLNTINAITDNLKKNVDKLDKFVVAELKDNDVNAIKQRGIDQIVHLKQQLFEVLSRTFDHIQARWINMFDQNHVLSMQKDKLVAELNQFVKMFLKSKQAANNLETDRLLVYEDLKSIISTISLLKDKDIVDKRVAEFLHKLERNSSSYKFPELSVNRLATNKLISDFKGLLTFSLEQDFDNLNSPQLFKIKQDDFFRPFRQPETGKPSQATEIVNKFVPIVAKNRRLMVYDTSVSAFKEFLLSDLHSIPHAAQIVMSPLNINRFLLVGGHYFKKPSDKVFELDATTAQFVILDNLKVARWMHRTAVHKNLVYVTGGVVNDKETPTNSVERFDLEGRKWVELKPLQHARHSHVAVFFDPNHKQTLSIDRKPASLFVLGGIGSNKRYVTAIERMDLDKGFWVEYNLKNSLPLELIGPFCSQINSKELVIFGGFKYQTPDNSQAKSSETVLQYPFGNSLIYQLSVEEKVMTANPHFNLPYSLINTGNQVIPHQSKLYFVGGLNTTTFYQDVQEIDFNQQYSLQKVVGTFAKDGLSLLDHILFHN
jgi:regulator of replication initiation timing